MLPDGPAQFRGRVSPLSPVFYLMSAAQQFKPNRTSTADKRERMNFFSRVEARGNVAISLAKSRTLRGFFLRCAQGILLAHPPPPVCYDSSGNIPCLSVQTGTLLTVYVVRSYTRFLSGIPDGH